MMFIMFLAFFSFLFFFFFFFFSVVLFYTSSSFFFEWDFLLISGVEFVWGFLVDWVSFLFLSVVSLISGSIMYYCIYYMDSEINYKRFSIILILFVSSMFFLIVSPNIISILLGWDGLGLTSYLLVIYYQNESSYNSGMLTVLSNRVGDVCILMSIGFFFVAGGWNLVFSYNYVSYVGVFFLIVAAMTKSAQIPFSAWLPAAMAAPTPVSSLVHSSTLVTAGIYLMIRFFNLLEMTGFFSILFYVGLLTMFMSGVVANFETDMKKVIALSTLSQLGLMMLVLGYGNYILAFFHLLTHALFKSMLFMCAGFMIHSMSSNQDGRFMSCFGLSSPFLSVSLMLTNLALCGFPFLAGFFSKDLLLEVFFFKTGDFFSLFLVIICMGLTVSYSLRLMYNCMSFCCNSSSMMNLSDFFFVNFFSSFLLLMFSMLGGYMLYWFFYFFSSINILVILIKYSVFSISLVSGILMFKYLDKGVSSMKKKVKVMRYYLSLMWFLPYLSGLFMYRDFFFFSGISMKVFEMGWFEICGGSGSSFFLKSGFMFLQRMQNSIMVYFYLLCFVMFFMFIIL